MENSLFPVFLKLEQLRVLLVGGGKIGHEKLTAMLANSPAVQLTVVATIISEKVKALAANYPHVRLVERAFEEHDLNEKDLVLIAVSDREISQSIRSKARERRLLVNAADTPDQCDFYLGSVVRKGAVKIAISTNGKSPTLAKRLREVFEDAFPENINESIEHLVRIRSYLEGDFSSKVEQLNTITRSFTVEKPQV
jgi:hypothetical protein